jgi:hypothetical protein
MRSSALLLIFAGFAFSKALSAKELSMYCHDQYYFCATDDVGQKHCAWPTGIGTERTVVLEKDPNYPNSNDPRIIWRGHHSEKFQETKIHLKIRVDENQDGSVGYSNDIAVTWNEMVSESSSGGFLRAAIRTKDDKGFGWICHEFKIQ